jgi:DMSO reductase family type II enzyme chaperone
MSELSYSSIPRDDSPERTIAAVREPAGTAPGRCLLYALCSDLTASPFDAEPAVADREIDFSELHLPYALGALPQVLRDWREADREQLKREYSGLFEVGSDGPPVPIREDLHREQSAGVREGIVRFYDFFGYGLSDSFAWAPDHLSVELEFMHFLAYNEAEKSGADALSCQLAQFDFAERHLVSWVPELADRIATQQPDAFYGKVLRSVSEFLLTDFAWQHTTIEQ